MRSFVAILALVAIAAVSVSAQSSTGAAPVATTICERVTAGQGLNAFSPADQYTAMTTLIMRIAAGTNTTGQGIFVNPVTADYFNGKINYRASTFVPSPFPTLDGGRSPNFNDPKDSQATAALVAHLVSFFGAPLGCTEGSTAFPKYTSSFGGKAFTQYEVHANMNITQTVFSSFNTQVLTAAVSMGATADDGTAVNAVLQSFGRNNLPNMQTNVICRMPDCACATGVTGDNCDNVNAVASVQASFITLAVAALVALFAMRR